MCCVLYQVAPCGVGLWSGGAVFRKTDLFCKYAYRPFKVVQGHWFWYESKARMRLPISPSPNRPNCVLCVLSSGAVRCWSLEWSSSSSASTSGQQSPSRSGLTRTWRWRRQSPSPSTTRPMTSTCHLTRSNSTEEVMFASLTNHLDYIDRTTLIAKLAQL